MSDKLSFAYYGVFHAWRDEDDVQHFESYHDDFVCSAIQMDLAEYLDSLREQIVFPEEEGYYSVWIIGHIWFSESEGPDGVEYDEDVVIETQEVSPAKTGCIEAINCSLPEDEKIPVLPVVPPLFT